MHENIPATLKRLMFKHKIIFPEAFFEGVASIADLLFPEGQSENEAVAVLQQTSKLHDFITHFGKDFYTKDTNGKPQIPDAVWEVMGARLDSLSPEEWETGKYSEAVEKIMADVYYRKNDPWPVDRRGISNDGNFVYLVSTAYETQEIIRRILNGSFSDDDITMLQDRYFPPRKLIDPNSSELEAYITENIRKIEFMLEYKDTPHLWSIALIQGAFSRQMPWHKQGVPRLSRAFIDAAFNKKFRLQEPFYAPDLIEAAGVSNSDIVKQAFLKRIHIEEHTRHITPLEAVYEILQNNVGPLKTLKNFHTDIPDDIIIFGLFADMLGDEQSRKELANLFGPDFVDRQVAYLSFIEAFKKENNLPNTYDSIWKHFGWVADDCPVSRLLLKMDGISNKEQGLLLDLDTIKDCFEMDRMMHLLAQRPTDPHNYRAMLLEMRNKINDIKKGATRRLHPNQNTEIRKIYLQHLYKTIETLSVASEQYGINFVKPDPH